MVDHQGERVTAIQYYQNAGYHFHCPVVVDHDTLAVPGLEVSDETSGKGGGGYRQMQKERASLMMVRIEGWVVVCRFAYEVAKIL